MSIRLITFATMVVNIFESVKLAFRFINNAKVSIGVNSAEVANRW